ncbi:MAG: ATP-dependent helicase [Methanobrevibacter sp.]|uniref:ATP-dependent helicase n=1 Tax=Methanobrevibacter sp. TaxID=66852 RepID=UPI0025F8D0A3|nr:ATP-dependent DNA helicase [Methanobrevibacter sp.]MBE6498052.1 ATP-dependent helicase [Methanobrevibacter sp.]MBE6499341.1 ATP-dependent helicase [Methanobrevibacter thaueri]
MDFVGNQKKVIEHGNGTLLVEAGPGSGKTTVIVERIKELVKQGVDPESFLVITFTTKAADNLKFKLRKELSNSTVLKMQISTIHSFCLEYLKSKNMSLTLLDDDTSEKKTLFIQKFKKELGFVNEATVFDYQIPAVLNKFGEYTCFNVDSNKLIHEINDSRVITKDYLDFVRSMDYFSKKRIDDYDKPLKKNKADDEELFSKSWYNARFLQIAKAYPRYLKLLDEYNYVDYDTLQLKALKELEKDPETKYTTIFVDEFQDTDPLQFRIFEVLRKNCEYFTAVGDVDQHIYAFRSSFNDFFDELIRLDNPDVLSLDVNFRSTENIVNLTEAFITPQRKETSQKHMRSNGKAYNNPNFLLVNENSDDEAQNVYNIIKRLKEMGLKDSDIAVLYRKHSDKTIANLIEKFNSDDDINYSVRGQADLASQNEVKSIITLLWYLSRNTRLGYVPSKDELKELSLKAFCGEYFEPVFWSLEDSTKSYLADLQKTYEDEILRIENEIRQNRGDGKVRAVHNVKKNEDQDTLNEIFKNLQLPIINIDNVHENDKEFFMKLDELRDKIESEEPPTILSVFYELIAMGDLFADTEANYRKIANLAILTQTITNYESFISETDLRGVMFFIMNSIENYESYQKEVEGVQLMTIHAAKGLEFPVTIITSLEKDKFPMVSRDPNREKDFIFPNDTYYTPNECLKYKTILKEENGELKHKSISIEEENHLNDEEEDRILYVAMTRAADLLILSTIGEMPTQIENIRDCTVPFTMEELNNVTIEESYEAPKGEQLVLNYSKYTQYKSCPFKYDLGYNLGFARPGIKAANRGTVFHEIMETVNLKLLDGVKVSAEELSQITYDTYKSMFDIGENPEEFEEFRTNVINYYETYSLERDVMAAELPFEIDKGNYLLNGAIDLIYKVSEDEIVILDYKYAQYDEDHIDGYTKQLYIYAAALKELDEYKNYTIRKAITHFVLGDYQHVVEINDEVMENELNGLNDVAVEIGNGCFSKDSGECDRCSYRLICKPQEFAGGLNG